MSGLKHITAGPSVSSWLNTTPDHIGLWVCPDRSAADAFCQIAGVLTRRKGWKLHHETYPFVCKDDVAILVSLTVEYS